MEMTASRQNTNVTRQLIQLVFWARKVGRCVRSLVVSARRWFIHNGSGGGVESLVALGKVMIVGRVGGCQSGGGSGVAVKCLSHSAWWLRVGRWPSLRWA